MTEQFPPIDWFDGYPTEASLEALRETTGIFDHAETGRYLRQELDRCQLNCCASFDQEESTDFFGKPIDRLFFSTGGWSGAERLIEALLSQLMIEICHVQWRRGGHYIFDVPRAQRDDPARTSEGESDV